MLNVPPGRIPSVDSGVVVVSGTVPVPVAGVGDEAALDDVPEDDVVEPVADELVVVELPEVPCSTACMADVNCDFVRVNASPLAMLARPFPRLVSAEAMTLISEASADWAADSFCALLQ